MMKIIKDFIRDALGQYPSFLGILYLFVIVAILMLPSCNNSVESRQADSKNEHSILSEDEMELKEAYKLQESISYYVTPDIETDPVAANNSEDAADDPAIWFNSDNPNKSVIYGSNKRGGIVAYNLKGEELKFYPVGNVNNIDVLDSLSSSPHKVQLLGGTNRSTQTIDLFFIDKNGFLTPARQSQHKVNPEQIDDVYGFCFGTDRMNNKDYLFVNGKNGHFEQYELKLQGDSIAINRVRVVKFDDQTEGMVVDNITGKIYIGAENTGIYELPINPESKNEKQLISSSTSKNVNIHYDIEGLALVEYQDSTYLVASSQGNFSFAIFNLSNENKYLKSFKIVSDQSIDGVEETDGLDIKIAHFNDNFPSGLFVVQDGFNYRNDTLVSQNFKIINIEKIFSIIDAD